MSREKGAVWGSVRERVLERDEWACRFCDVTDDEHRDGHGRGLDVHHIIPENDGGRDQPENLITVCQSCHKTLEQVHAQGVGEMYRTEREHVTHVWGRYDEIAERVNNKLATFADGHPTYTQEFTISQTPDGCIEAHDFFGATGTSGSVSVSSEWDFAVAFGYKEGVLDVVTALEDRLDVPFEQSNSE